MGLLDQIGYGNQGGYGGLLDMLMYPNQQWGQPQPMMPGLSDGGPTAASPDDPFGPTPNRIASMFPQAPPPAPRDPFAGGASPIAGLPQNMAPQAPALPPAQMVAPAPQADPSPVMNIGGYQMPQMGAMADYTPVGGATDFSAQSRRPQVQEQPQAAQQALPPAFGGGGYMDRINNGGSLVGSLFKDTSQQQNLTAKFEAYQAAGLTRNQAMLAVMNPKAGEIADQRILEKKKYEFIKDDSGRIIAGDPTTGKTSVSYGGDEANRTGVAGPDGKIIPYPEGLDAAGRKTFGNEIARINADAAAGKKTEVQAKSEKFGNRMELAERNLAGLEGEGTSLFGQIASGVPLGNYVQSKSYQKYAQAKSSFIQAMLRDESGAAIGTPEFVRLEKEMFPQPGDGPESIAQKAEARKVAVEGMKKSAGPGYKPPADNKTAGPSRADIEAEIRRRGLMK